MAFKKVFLICNQRNLTRQSILSYFNPFWWSTIQIFFMYHLSVVNSYVFCVGNACKCNIAYFVTGYVRM